MAKLTLGNVTNLENQGSTVSTINNNSDLIEAAIENTVSRSGLSPNQMAAQLDMNNNKVINLPLATSGGDAVSLNKLDTSLTASTVRYDIPQNLNPLQQQQARDNINVDIFGGAGSSGGSGNVTSVFGRFGVVVAQTGDYSVGQVTGAAPIASPIFTGVPAAPTAAVGNNTTQLATTAFVLANVGSGAVPSVFGRTGSVTAASGDYSAGLITNVPAGGIASLTVQSALNELDTEKANLLSPTFTGIPAAPTPSPGDNDTSIATTAFVQAALASSATSLKNIIVQTFTTSGTYTPSVGMLFAIIECVGGGGGGGGATISGALTFSGGGGGSGAYSRKRVTATDIGASKIVTIGAGGSPQGFNGATGGDTSVGSLCLAKGGSGGGGCSISVVGNGGAGGLGSAGVGDVTASGSSGGGGFYNAVNNGIVAPGGTGGSSFFGGGAQATWSLAGLSGRAYGGAGSGAGTNTAGANFVGGLGFAGVVIITEFL